VVRKVVRLFRGNQLSELARAAGAVIVPTVLFRFNWAAPTRYPGVCLAGPQTALPVHGRLQCILPRHGTLSTGTMPRGAIAPYGLTRHGLAMHGRSEHL
jgi:hypothetical protein